MVRKTWAVDVIKFNKRGVATETQELLCSSVKSFLRAWVDEELDYNFKLSLSNEEMMDKQNEEAMTLEDMRKIYNECQSNRDRALILVAANGVAPEEMIQFTQRHAPKYSPSPRPDAAGPASTVKTTTSVRDENRFDRTVGKKKGSLVAL